MIQTASGPIYVPDAFPGLGGSAPAPQAAPNPVVPQLDASVLQGMGLDPTFGGPGPSGIGAGGIANPFPDPAQSTPDYALPKVQAAKVQASDAKATQAYDAGAPARAKADRQAAATAASPEGQIASSTEDQQRILREQAATAEASGAIAGQEADQNAADLERRNLAVDKLREDRQREEQERAKGLQEHTAAYNKAVDAEANYKIDDNRRWHELGTGRKILAGIGVALSGLGDALAHKHGPNLALGMIMDAIKDDVGSQMRERDALGKVADRKKNSIDTYRQMTGDLREAGNLKMAEEYKRVADQMEATAQKYASPKAKLGAAANANELRVRAAALLGQSAEGRFAREMQRGQLANSQAQTGLGYANLKQGKYEFQENLKLHVRDQFLKAQELEQQGNIAGAKALKDSALKDNELGMSAPAELKKDANGLILTDDKGEPVLDRGAMLSNQDGSVWHAPDAPTRKVLADKMTAAHEIVNILDEAAKIRDNVGGESASGNSDEYQRLKVLQNRLVILAKSGTQGMSSEEDMKKLSEALGASDLTSFRAKAAGIEEGRLRTLGELNTSLRYQGNYSGKPIDIPNLAKAVGPQNSAEDEGFKATIARPHTSYDEALDQALKPALEQYRKDRASDPAGAAQALNVATKKAKKEAESYKDITPDQRRRIDVLASNITSGTEQSKRNARLQLAKVSTDGETPAIRDAAQQALVAAGLTGSDQPTEPTGRSAGGFTGTSTAMEDAPPPLPPKGKR